MHHAVAFSVMLAEFMDLGMAVVASGNAVIRAGGLNLLIFELALSQPLTLEAGLQEPATAAAAEIVGFVGGHVDEVFFAYHGFDHKPQIIGNGVAKGFSDNLARILNREFNFKIFIPVGIDLEFALADPFGVIFVNIFDYEVVVDLEFFQSCQD
jgi:hypothetical protein